MFLLISFISMLISPYREAAFFGSEGRYQGFLTLMVYGIMVALISRYPVKTKGFIGCFLLGGAVVLGIGACQYLLLDPFGLVARIQEFERYMFFSTIGYTNFYSCYAAMVTVIAMGVCGVGAGKMRLHRLWSIRRPQEWSRADTQW